MKLRSLMNGVTRSRTSQARTARWAIVRRRAIFGAAVFVAASFVGLGPAQAAPTAGIPIFQGFVNQTVSGSVANFSWKVPGTHDPGATFEFLSNTSSNGSSLTGSSNGDFVYTPTPDNCGIGFVPFRVRNPDGSTADGSLEVINAPDGVDDQFVTPVNTAITADLGTNDVVGYRPSVQWFRNVYTSGPSHGTVTMAAEGSYNNSSFTYTPSAGYTGFDQFEYWVVCGNKTDAAVVTINVGNVAGTPTTTTTPPTTTTVPAGSCASSGWPTYEAECATIGGSIAVERSSTASNGAVLGGWNYGGTFTLPVTPSTAGSQTLEIRYGAPYGASQRTLTVNGVAQTVSLPRSPGFSTVTVAVDLVAGSNTVGMTRNAGDDGVVNADKLSFSTSGGTSTTVTPTTAAPTTAAPTTVGPTTAPPAGGCATSQWPTYEGECALLAGSIAVEKSAAASSGAVAGAWNYGGMATFAVNAPSSGQYRVDLRYTAPYGGGRRTMTVNGVASSVSFTPSAALATTSTNVVLQAESNTIALSRQAGDDGVMNLDLLTFTLVGAVPTTTTTTTTLPAGGPCSPAGWGIHEAECSELTGALAVEKSPAASGQAVVGAWSYGGVITMRPTAPSSGTSTMTIRFSTPYGASTRTVVVNGVTKVIALPGSVPYTTVSVNVTLAAGANTITFERRASNDGVVNLDRVNFGDPS